MHKIILPILLSLFLLAALPTRAADTVVNCSGSGSCSLSGANPLFSSADGLWYPGRSLTKTFTIINSSPDSQLVGLRSSRNGSQSNLEDAMVVSLLDPTLVWSGSLVDFNQYGEIQLAALNPGTSADFSLTATFKSSAGNDYQNLQTVFDLILGFIAQEQPSPTPTSSPSPTPTVYLNPPSGVILNEIMPNPASGKEWVEIYNSNPYSVQLKQWKIDDIQGGGCNPKNLNIINLAPNGFYVYEYPFDCLNNDGDTVRLLNQDDQLMDSKSYSASEVSTLHSLSRQSSNSWCLALTSYGLANNLCFGVTPTPTTSTTGEVLSASNNSGGGVGGANPPVCSDASPAAPTNLSAILQSPSSVLLSWSPPASAYTSYLVAYGNQPDTYLYGNPNIGNDNSYLVASLTPAARYCFAVRAQNGCAPGPYSNEVCIGSTSALPLPTTAPIPGFSENVLGEQNEAASPSAGEVQGVQLASLCPNPWLPLMFLLSLVFNLNYLSRKVRHSPPAPVYLIIPLLVSSVAFLFDSWILKTRCCTSPAFCRFYSLGCLISFILPSLVYFYPRFPRSG
jgi:hypothetical protein